MARAADKEGGGTSVGSTLWLVAILVLWFVMNKWVLPKLGVPTWMAPQCSLEREQKPPEK